MSSLLATMKLFSTRWCACRCTLIIRARSNCFNLVRVTHYIFTSRLSLLSCREQCSLTLRQTWNVYLLFLVCWFRLCFMYCELDWFIVLLFVSVLNVGSCFILLFVCCVQLLCLCCVCLCLLFVLFCYVLCVLVLFVLFCVIVFLCFSIFVNSVLFLVDLRFLICSSLSFFSLSICCVFFIVFVCS